MKKGEEEAEEAEEEEATDVSEGQTRAGRNMRKHLVVANKCHTSCLDASQSRKGSTKLFNVP